MCWHTGSIYLTSRAKKSLWASSKTSKTVGEHLLCFICNCNRCSVRNRGKKLQSKVSQSFEWSIFTPSCTLGHQWNAHSSAFCFCIATLQCYNSSALIDWQCYSSQTFCYCTANSLCHFGSCRSQETCYLKIFKMQHLAKKNQLNMQVENSSSSWRIGGVSTSQCYIVSLFDASFVSLSLCLDFNVEDQLGHFREDFFLWHVYQFHTRTQTNGCLLKSKKERKEAGVVTPVTSS